MPLFPQGPHGHQGPHSPYGGTGNPWLSLYSASYVNIQDPKQRRIAFNNVQEHIKEASATKYESLPAQVSSSGSSTPRNNPVCFSDLITETFRQQAGGAICLQTTLPITRRRERRSFTLRPIGSRS